MSSNYCKICNSTTQTAFSCIALKKYSFEAAICHDCGLLQIVEPHWLDEAYGEAIAEADTGLVSRNLSLANDLTPLLFHLFEDKGCYVDFSGGTGLLVRLMRDTGFDFRWRDPYCKNIHARGFEFNPDIHKCNAVTAFEVLEHILNPVDFIRDAMSTAGADLFICTTQLFEGRPPDPTKWWYYAFEAGQHISFYQRKTLAKIAGYLNLNLFTNGLIHIFYKNQYQNKINKYYNSKFVRILSRRRSSRNLSSKTMSDHLMIIKHR